MANMIGKHNPARIYERVWISSIDTAYLDGAQV